MSYWDTEFELVNLMGETQECFIYDVVYYLWSVPRYQYMKINTTKWKGQSTFRGAIYKTSKENWNHLK